MIFRYAVISFLFLAAVASVSSDAYALMKQDRIVRTACDTGDMRFFQPKEEYIRMCSAVRLETLMPKAPDGWEQQTISWAIKLAPEELGFREGEETRGLFTQYRVYPIVKYQQEKGKGRIIIMGTVDGNQAIDRQTDLQKFLLTKEENLLPLEGDVEYYQEKNWRASPFDAQKKWFATHVSMYNTAYFVVYAENVDDREMVIGLLKNTDWSAVRRKIKGAEISSGK